MTMISRGGVAESGASDVPLVGAGPLSGGGTGEGDRAQPGAGHGTDIGLCDDMGSLPSQQRTPDMFDRLFGSKTADPALAERIPPGQYKTDKFPVLHYGSVPHTDLATWD